MEKTFEIYGRTLDRAIETACEEFEQFKRVHGEFNRFELVTVKVTPDRYSGPSLVWVFKAVKA